MIDDLPPGWAWAQLQDLAAAEPRAITDGPFGSNLKTAHYTDDGPRVIRLQNIGDGVFKPEEAHVSQEHYETLLRHEAQAGDLIVASLGEGRSAKCFRARAWCRTGCRRQLSKLTVSACGCTPE